MAKNIDEILSEAYAAHGEFKVPDGYFDTLQQRIMAGIPAESRRHLILRMPARLKYAVAACLTGIIVCGGIMTFNATQDDKAIATAPASSEKAYTSDSYVQDCMDYAMVDDNDVYNYIADKE